MLARRVSRADAEAVALTVPGCPFTPKGKGKLGQVVLEPQGAAGVGLHEFGQALGEDAAWAGFIATTKAPHLELDAHRALAPGEIGQGSEIAALDALAGLRAVWADGLRVGRGHRQGQALRGDKNLMELQGHSFGQKSLYDCGERRRNTVGIRK